MFKVFKKEKKPQDIKDILMAFEALEKKVDSISQGFDKLKKDVKIPLQKVGFLRYNPFSGTGGDQSFSIALLDQNNNGFVITSIYSGDGTRVYAKSIKNGGSEYSLSSEENNVIKKAIDEHDKKE